MHLKIEQEWTDLMSFIFRRLVQAGLAIAFSAMAIWTSLAQFEIAWLRASMRDSYHLSALNGVRLKGQCMTVAQFLSAANELDWQVVLDPNPIGSVQSRPTEAEGVRIIAFSGGIVPSTEIGFIFDTNGCLK